MTRAKVKKLILTGQEDTDSYERLLAQKDVFTVTSQSVSFPGPRPRPTTRPAKYCNALGENICPGIIKDDSCDHCGRPADRSVYKPDDSDQVAALANQSFWETVHKCYPQVRLSLLRSPLLEIARKLSGEVLSLTGPSSKKFDTMCRKMVKEWVENNKL